MKCTGRLNRKKKKKTLLRQKRKTDLTLIYNSRHYNNLTVNNITILAKFSLK